MKYLYNDIRYAISIEEIISMAIEIITITEIIKTGINLEIITKMADLIMEENLWTKRE